MDYHPTQIEVLEVSDPRERDDARRQWEQADRNTAWLSNHAAEVYATPNRGKVVCIAGEEAFYADTVEEAVSRATAAHPDDKGWFTLYIPRQKVTMVYAT